MSSTDLNTSGKIAQIIKVVSTILMSMAIALLVISAETELQQYKWLLWLASIAVIGHGIEGLIGAIYSYRNNLNPLKAFVLIFFTGIVGLSETFKATEAE